MTLTPEQETFAKTALGEAVAKLTKVVARVGEKVPYTAHDGIYDDRSENIDWWTNGFFGGILWQLYSVTQDESIREKAVAYEAKLDRCLMNDTMLDHDNGFKWLPTAGADYILTESEAAKNRLLLAASNLMGRFNLNGRFIRAWNDWGTDDHRGWAIIDCLMNLPLLYRASDITGDPRFRQVAMAHADTAAKNFVRADGSCEHIVEFDPRTGSFVRIRGGQGMKDGSAWTRGQSWGIYGFALSYMHTKSPAYIENSRKIADYYMAHVPKSKLIPVDFCQPADCGFEDDCSAAIAACGLIELSKALPDAIGDKYLDAAVDLLKALYDNTVDKDENHDILLTRCSASYNEENHNYPIIYGDYYYLEALLKLNNKGIFIW
ncbi:MAG: glycoside hydrolase family 88 protein [Lachnospiraceae bacterium]|nr:glycoside hydrolase family 88 protein [Lachnospiraceae bacterium]